MAGPGLCAPRKGWRAPATHCEAARPAGAIIAVRRNWRLHLAPFSAGPLQMQWGGPNARVRSNNSSRLLTRSVVRAGEAKPRPLRTERERGVHIWMYTFQYIHTHITHVCVHMGAECSNYGIVCVRVVCICMSACMHVCICACAFLFKATIMRIYIYI